MGWRRRLPLPDEQRVFLVGLPAVAGVELAQAPEGAKSRLDGGDDRHALPGGPDDGLLQERRGLLDTPGEVRDDPVDLLGLGRGQRERARGLFGNRVRLER